MQAGNSLLDENSRDDYISLLGSNADIITSNELHGNCERFAQKPSQRSRIIIARSMDPNVNLIDQSSQPNMASGMNTERPKLGDLEGNSMEQMNTTFHFK
jgi:hypothetical protein